MSEPPPTPDPPRKERALLRCLTAAAVLACSADVGIAIARVGHTLSVSEAAFNILTTWTICLIFLGILTYFMRDDDRHLVRLLARLDVGNEALDDVLGYGTPARRDWRLRPATRTVMTAAAAACWFAAVLCTAQMALGASRINTTTQMMVLRLFLTCANLSTVIALATIAPSRRAAALELVYDAHSTQRAKRAILARAAEDAETTGEMGKIHLDDSGCTVTTVDFEGRRTQRGERSG